jgi:hypothetical protein
MLPHRRLLRGLSLFVTVVTALALALLPGSGVTHATEGRVDATAMSVLDSHVFLPLLLKPTPPPVDCISRISDNFSDPASGWPVKTFRGISSGYLEGRYQIDASSLLWEPYHFGVSPNWEVPDTATLQVVAWIEQAPSVYGASPAVSLVFGLQLFPHQGEFLWWRWYEFRVRPLDQGYTLRKWDLERYEDLSSGTSSSILPDLAARQTLRVERVGNSFTLFVNGTELETVVDPQSPLAGPGSFALAGGDASRLAFDDFELQVDGCITLPAQ